MMSNDATRVKEDPHTEASEIILIYYTLPDFIAWLLRV